MEIVQVVATYFNSLLVPVLLVESQMFLRQIFYQFFLRRCLQELFDAPDRRL